MIMYDVLWHRKLIFIENLQVPNTDLGIFYEIDSSDYNWW